MSLRTDYIILGSGLAGLSLAARMVKSGLLEHQTLLIVDKAPKQGNDRTWCFWEYGKGFFENCVYHQWPSLQFYSEGFEKDLDMYDYSYKMIRSGALYDYCNSLLQSCKNVSFLYGDVSFHQNSRGNTGVQVNGEQLDLDGSLVFNSILKKEPEHRLSLKQHFKGWIIETATPSFDAQNATLMDFRVDQTEGTTFVYVLPLSTTTALVEYTLFTAHLLQDHQYDAALRNYIQQYLGITLYEVKETEFGVIPMTAAEFEFYKNGMYHIGTAGGQTKGSSGYTFQFVQKQTKSIVNSLLHRQKLQQVPAAGSRFHFYDRVLLELLVNRTLEGREIFTRLFQQNKAHKVFKFLDNETDLLEDLGIISSLQIVPFAKAAMRVM